MIGDLRMQHTQRDLSHAERNGTMLLTLLHIKV